MGSDSINMIINSLLNANKKNAELENIVKELTNVKRKIFVSYHHSNDQYYYDTFSKTFSEYYNLVRDNSLDRIIDSDNPEYIMRKIRENYITGTSCTIVLCGFETHQRKYVDWKIKATLDKKHGLIGLKLPTICTDYFGNIIIPARLYDNLKSGYAMFIDWNEIIQSPYKLCDYINQAIQKPSWLIDNSRPMKLRNG